MERRSRNHPQERHPDSPLWFERSSFCRREGRSTRTEAASLWRTPYSPPKGSAHPSRRFVICFVHKADRIKASHSNQSTHSPFVPSGKPWVRLPASTRRWAAEGKRAAPRGRGRPSTTEGLGFSGLPSLFLRTATQEDRSSGVKLCASQLFLCTLSTTGAVTSLESMVDSSTESGSRDSGRR